jgi:activating signal cointegrator complex subunit 3
VKEAAKLLDSRRMLRYDPRSGNLAVTDMGRVASHFYIQNESIATFNELLARMPDASEAQLIHVICSACEFVNVKVRQEELKEIDELKARFCTMQLHSSVEDSAGKSNVLLQAFIGHAKPNSFTLTSDINYIASNAGRVARALFEMCLRAGKAAIALKLLRIAKSVDKRMWWYQSPLRQFADDLPGNIFPALESRGYVSFDYTLSILEMNEAEVGQLAHWQRGGKVIQKTIRFLPNIHMECTVQPVTRGILKFSVELSANFDWNARYCGGALGFWLWVEDGDNDRIYHQVGWERAHGRRERTSAGSARAKRAHERSERTSEASAQANGAQRKFSSKRRPKCATPRPR